MFPFQTVEPYLKNVTLMVLASSNNNRPWCATVFYAYDNSLDVYFLSKLHRRHSQEILKNSNVSAAVVEQVFNFGDKTKGVQLEGKCNLLKGEEAKQAFAIYASRFPSAAKLISVESLTFPQSTSSNEPHGIWKISPSKIKVFDEALYGSAGKEFTP